MFSLSFLVLCALQVSAQHPRLLLTPEGVESIRAELGNVPIFDREVTNAKAAVLQAIADGIDVPVPKDMAGGYTHEVHKRNWLLMQQAGALYQFTGEAQYAAYVRDMLMEYAALYPTLPIHPTGRSYATGKIFWQCLNDANWLVYVSQAYDCIYNYLSEEERNHLETDLFRPFADFLSVENPQFFDRIHNHSTWGCAAVGMIGLVMEDEELISRALYGLGSASELEGKLDNDGGLLVKPGQSKLGFLAQMDGSFSPDGYFTEGPYYLRYAIFPFVLFSAALDNSMPEMDILGYRDSILQKAVYALINQTDANGLIFPINDAQKGMSWKARGVVTGVDQAYLLYGQDPLLLSVAKLQNWVTLDVAGFMVARDLQRAITVPLARKSILYRDGEQGDKGGVAILRGRANSNRELTVVMKYGAQGGGHGHYDRLSYSLYGEKGEIVQDYGAARWVNVDQKGGGRYLPENNSWAKQTIAHNTVVIDGKTQFDGNIRVAEEHAPKLYSSHISDEDIQFISVKDSMAYEGTHLHRTLVLIADSGLKEPLLLDVFKVTSDAAHQIDLPLWYQGHFLSSEIEFTEYPSSLSPLGDADGYEHMWLEGQGIASGQAVSLTWYSQGEFTTVTSATEAGDLLLTSFLGANDPLHNLRRDPVLIFRKEEATNALFVNVIESHGQYDPADEIPHNPYGAVETVQILMDTEAYTIVSVSLTDGSSRLVMIANQDHDSESMHEVSQNETTWTWKGPFHYQNNNK